MTLHETAAVDASSFPGEGSPGARRRKTRVVRVGDVGVGGDNPIRLQSMTTTPTRDVESTVNQAVRIIRAGGEIVRVTAPTELEARLLKDIKAGLLAKGFKTPIAADVHFSPQAAMEAAKHVEKVRINPGNFADAKAFKVREYSDEEYAADLARVEERFAPLVLKLKRLGRALRIGVNHGSLSDRILNRWGDTPEGMVVSALEFLRISEKLGYRDVIVSLKASNPKIMIAANRLFAARAAAEGMDVPLHLGVTEAGQGEDGRIKSAVGIGSLLEEGLGDTIRVSLTEDPEREIPVARALAAPYHRPPKKSYWPPTRTFEVPRRRAAREIAFGPLRLGGEQPVRAVTRSVLSPGLWAVCEARRTSSPRAPFEILELDIRSDDDLRILRDISRRPGRPALLVRARDPGRLDAALEAADAALAPAADAGVAARRARARGKPLVLEAATAEDLIAAARTAARTTEEIVLSLTAPGPLSDLLGSWRRLAADPWLTEKRFPFLLQAPPLDDADENLLRSSVLLGSLLSDGVGDAAAAGRGADPGADLRLTYDILQGAGARAVKTEFVSCPSCGRTLFDLQAATGLIQKSMGHLAGVKIAIMGCIVNGPGEMADADFGYVGAGPGRINLYAGRECVEKGVPEDEAVQKLAALIKSRGKWLEPA